MIAIPKRTFYAAIAIATTGTGLATLLFSGTVIPQLVSPLSIPLVLLVPGLLAYCGLSRSLHIGAKEVIYAFGLSASLLMFLGFFVNLPYQMMGATLIRPLPIWLSFGALLVGLALWVDRRVSADVFTIALPTSVQPYLFSSIAITAAVGAMIVEGGGSNTVVLIALGLIFLVYALGAFRPSHRVALLYFLALALLLHNTLGSEFLLWGDQGKEATIAYQVLQAGHWTPQELPRANKAAMLRISLLHPIHVLLTGLEIRLIFKILHPILFAVTPVGIYAVFADRSRAQAGYIGAGAFMFSFPFITVLSRNTRTAAAIMFMVLFLYALLDKEISQTPRRVLVAVFGISVFVCHYGAGYMFAAMLGGGFVVGTLGQYLLHQDGWRYDDLPRIPIVLIGIIATAWYTYISPGSASLRTLAGFLITFSTKLQEGFFQPSNSATANYATASFSSLSLTGVKILTVVLFALIGIGWLFAFVRAQQESVGIESSASYLAISMFAGALVGVTFLPVERFNTARTMMVSLAVVAPLFLIGVRGIIQLIDRKNTLPKQVPAIICLAVLFPYFIFASGLLAATVTHDYSPNTLVYRNDVILEGTPESNEYLYKQFTPDTGATGSQWLKEYAIGDVYGNTWPGNPNPGSFAERREPATHGFRYHGNVSAVPPQSCLYLSPLSVDAGVVNLPTSHFGRAYAATSELNTSLRSQVYVNGGAELYCAIVE